MDTPTTAERAWVESGYMPDSTDYEIFAAGYNAGIEAEQKRCVEVIMHHPSLSNTQAFDVAFAINETARRLAEGKS